MGGRRGARTVGVGNDCGAANGSSGGRIARLIVDNRTHASPDRPARTFPLRLGPHVRRSRLSMRCLHSLITEGATRTTTFVSRLLQSSSTTQGEAMATKTKPMSLDDVIASFPTIGTGRDVEAHVAQRRALTEGRTVAELDQIAQALVEIDRDGDAQARAHAGWLLIRLAEADHAAAKAASKAGAPIPACPFLDAMTRRTADMTSTKATTKKRSGNGSGATRKTATDVRFTHNGVVMALSNNRLSTQAYHFTKGIDGKARLTTREYEALLKTLGVTNPYGPGWEVKLPNGHTVGAVKEGETPTPVVVDKPTKSTAKQVLDADRKHAGTTKSTPKKATAAKKGAASKPLSKTPAPRKAVAAKKTAAKKVTAKA